LRRPPPPPPEEHVEDVHAALGHVALLEALEAELVVLGALLLVAEHLVGRLDLLELLGVAALVRVLLERQLAEGLLDLRLRGLLLQAEDVVERLGVGGLALAAAHAAHAGHAAVVHAEGDAPGAAEEHGAGAPLLLLGV